MNCGQSRLESIDNRCLCFNHRRQSHVHAVTGYGLRVLGLNSCQIGWTEKPCLRRPFGRAWRPGLLAPGLTIGAGVKPHHVGVLGYLVLASDNLGEAMAAYQRYERLFYGVDLAEVRML
ncbi:MAG: hypothetical protein RLZZ369_1698, partial [Pseudomonadota bacterium]